MPINSGYVEQVLRDGDVVVRVYYDATQPAGPDQALVDGPRGYCLDMTNVSGGLYRADLVDAEGVTVAQIRIQQGDPVTTGPPSGRSRTAAQLAQAVGWTTRGQVLFRLVDE